MRVLPCDPAQTVRLACGGSALPANRSEPRATARNGFKSRDPGPRQPRPQARRRAQGEAGTERARVQSSVPVPLRQLGCARARLSCAGVSPRSWLPALPPRPTDAETETESPSPAPSDPAGLTARPSADSRVPAGMDDDFSLPGAATGVAAAAGERVCVQLRWRGRNCGHRHARERATSRRGAEAATRSGGTRQSNAGPVPGRGLVPVAVTGPPSRACVGAATLPPWQSIHSRRARARPVAMGH